MTAINYAELALIELEYSAADHSARLSATSDPLERADLSLRVRTILTAITAVQRRSPGFAGVGASVMLPCQEGESPSDVKS
jgi:hypothetical protein